MNSRDVWPVLFAPILGIVAIIQSVLGPRLVLFQVKPDLMLLVVLAWTLMFGSRNGVVIGFIGGVWLDLLSGGVFGASSLGLILASLVTGIGQNLLYRTNLLVPILATLGGTLIYSLTYLFVLQLAGQPLFSSSILYRLVIPAAIYNTVLMLLFTPFLNRVADLQGVS